MDMSKEVKEIFNETVLIANKNHYEFVTPELLLYSICHNSIFVRAFKNCGGKIRSLQDNLRKYLDKYMEIVQDNRVQHSCEFSQGMKEILAYALEVAEYGGKNKVELPHIIFAIYQLQQSYAVYYMNLQEIDQIELLQELTVAYEMMTSHGYASHKDNNVVFNQRKHTNSQLYSENHRKNDREIYKSNRSEKNTQQAAWQEYALCLNDKLEGSNPLIGRQQELERTMQILCRKEKNNPLHIGEPGVGKTAITYGLAKLLNEGTVPPPLKGAKIFSLDLGSLLAGTQYRGDFEKRFKMVMDSINNEENPIIYIDEIHNIVGAGAVNGGAFDISNMLKPYLVEGHIRFIGATTYEEYKKHFEKNKSLVRRFQNMEIKEPSIEDTVKILEGLKDNYENFHGVTYKKGVLQYAVEMSAKYQNERYLPDKAIDLIDEAGAYRQIHPLDQKVQYVNKELIDEILSKTCRIPKQVVAKDETKSLATLEKRMLNDVYGQNDAISQIVNAVKFSRAGLLEEGKPLASFLFVGPTGVGKTQIAKSLAKELSVKLVRFDMSEYEEKHAVAKLIGAPAGYVGYEEGGLLTEEIRKNPHCILLLDEIEKAHPDIYNVLLQVMDYATLTDNQGRKADFRNVVIIMTSNAGASRIGKKGIGFGDVDIKSDIILEEVKRIFQPEFRNRLSKIIVFNTINEKMAEQIVDKKLRELQTLLLRKNVKINVYKKAKNLIKQKGISAEFGARQIERVIQSEIKPLMVDQILFGMLKKGGKCKLTTVEERFDIQFLSKEGE